MTDDLIAAAGAVVHTQRRLAEPYVPTSRTSPSPGAVGARKAAAARDALHALAVAAAAAESPRAHVTGSADGLLVHRVGPDHRQVCTGEPVPDVAVTPTVEALADVPACGDCGWRLL